MDLKRIKIMKGKIITTFLTIVVFAALVIPVVYFSHREDMKCDQVVFLEGETSMDARGVYTNEGGMSTIYLCNGTEMKVPTIRIVKIIEKEDVQ